MTPPDGLTSRPTPSVPAPVTGVNPSVPEQYGALDARMRLVLQILALFLVEVPRADLRKVANRVRGATRMGGKLFSFSELDEIRDELRNARLLGTNRLCTPAVAGAVARAAIEEPAGRALLQECMLPFDRSIRDMRYHWINPEHFRNGVIAARIAVFADDADAFEVALQVAACAREYRSLYGHYQAWRAIGLRDVFAGLEGDPDWLLGRNGEIVEGVLATLLGDSGQPGACTPAHAALFDRACETVARTLDQNTMGLLLEWGLRSGNWAWCRMREPHNTPCPHDDILFYEAAIRFLEGDAVVPDLFSMAMHDKRARTGKRKVLPPGSTGHFMALGLLADSPPSRFREARTLIDAGSKNRDEFALGYRILGCMLDALAGRDIDAAEALQRLEGQFDQEAKPPFDRALLALAQGPVKSDALNDQERARMARLRSELGRHETVPRLMMDGGLAAVDVGTGTGTGRRAPDGVRDFRQLLQYTPSWDRRISALMRVMEGESATDPESAGSRRVIWLLDPDTPALTVVQQTRLKRGGWSTGRVVPVRRLHEKDGSVWPLLTATDLAALYIRENTDFDYRARGEPDVAFDLKRALPALIGHPAVYHAADRSRRLELVAGSVELVVSRAKGGYLLKLSHWSDVPCVFVEQEVDDRYRVVGLDAALVQGARLIGRGGLRVPRDAKDRIVDLCKTTSSLLVVRSQVRGIETPMEPGDATPIIRLEPSGQGLRVTVCVRPCGPDGVHFPVGSGPQVVSDVRDGARQQFERRFEEETAAATALVATCPTLDSAGSPGFEWILQDLESSFDFMMELQAIPGPVTIEWPDGVPIPAARPVGTRNFTASVRRERDWFALTGSVQIDEDLVIDMRDLLDSLDNATGRFVRLGDGKVVALTEALHRQLAALRSISTGRGKTGERIHPLGAMAIEEFLDGAVTGRAGATWRKFRSRLEAARTLQPEIPGGLRAELRGYQQEGFVWASRLAHIGAGACLADDMGLGKTVQALALLLDRRAGGPALVIAPTSVCHNWEEEAARFAPELKIHPLGGAAGRGQVLDELGPGDVLVASYGLVRENAEALSAVAWHTLVIDEAQAIKNPDAQRTRAVRSLDARFRIALTGTPIENSLEELWSLFSVLNPGLLGTRAAFRRRFAAADTESEVRQHLRTAVRPFILRRRKKMVLAELPSRTEQVIHVEPDVEERAFLEAVRRQAVERISGLEEVAPQNRRFQLLSEITRLRRACCHPRLVDPDSPLPGAKLETAKTVLRTLIEEGHKALVFSQFVSHLNLLRPWLEEEKIPYQYLDGATSARLRKKRVTAFQNGVGALFLISLRAGGTGLNLTAADYVIHLDPWWNPAVEDQASDRAHRIGQRRPVTVYRLVVRESIEEKILDLHDHKRELADDILSGTEVAKTLTEEDLQELIAGA